MHSSMASRRPETSIFQASTKHRSTLLQSCSHFVVFSWPKLTLGDLHSCFNMLKDEKDFERSHHALQLVLAEDRNDINTVYRIWNGLPRAPSRPSKQLVISITLSYQSNDGALF